MTCLLPSRLHPSAKAMPWIGLRVQASTLPLDKLKDTLTRRSLVRRREGGEDVISHPSSALLGPLRVTWRVGWEDLLTPKGNTGDRLEIDDHIYEHTGWRSNPVGPKAGGPPPQHGHTCHVRVMVPSKCMIRIRRGRRTAPLTNQADRVRPLCLHYTALWRVMTWCPPPALHFI